MASEAKRCERCGARRSGVTAGAFDLFDYCAVCSRDLCDSCMGKGCCGNVPARSGNADECEADEANSRLIEEAIRQQHERDDAPTDTPADRKG